MLFLSPSGGQVYWYMWAYGRIKTIIATNKKNSKQTRFLHQQIWALKDSACEFTDARL